MAPISLEEVREKNNCEKMNKYAQFGVKGFLF